MTAPPTAGSGIPMAAQTSPRSPRGLSSKVGARRPLHVTALGKALTAFLPAKEQERILGELKFEPATPNSIMNLAEFRHELEQVCQQGYAIDDEEVVLGARCLGAPVFGSERVPIAAVSISGPVTRISLESVPVLAGTLVTAARSISAALGFSSLESAPLDENVRAKRTSVLA